MNWGILIAVIIYEIFSIFIVTALVSRKHKKNAAGSDFAFASGGLSSPLVGITLGLTLLGAAHNWGTCQNSATMGVMGAWMGIACSVMMVVITQICAPWIRRTGSKTISEFMGKIFGKNTRIALACVQAALGIAMACMEIEVIGVTLSALTGWDYMLCSLIGGIFAMLYVVLAGMNEVAWLNVINAVVMWASLIVVLISLARYLPGGWDGIEATLTANPDTEWFTNLFGSKTFLIAFALPNAIGASVFHAFSQAGYQAVATAKDNRAVKKSLWFASPINGCFCIIPALIGVAAFAIPQFREAGTMMMSPMMIVTLLPKPVIALLAAGFLGVNLSSFAVMALAPATIISHDVYTIKEPHASEKKLTKLTRLWIVIIGIVSIIICKFQPQPVIIVNWIFGFGAPVFVMVLIGLWWKRSEKAAIITLIVSWIVLCIWSTFGLQNYLGLTNFNGVYLSIICSAVIGIITTVVCPGKKGLFAGLKKKA